MSVSIILALFASLFASFTSIFAKIGIEHINSNLATAVRTVVVVIMAFLIVLATGHTQDIITIPVRSLFFLVISGLSTGLSWLCYFKAIQIGNVSRVAPIDKSSVVLTIILAFLILNEPATPLVISGGIVITIGTFVLLGENKDKKHTQRSSKRPSYLYLAVLSAFFAALTNILAKLGIENINSNVATFIRTVVIIIFSWGIVVFQGTFNELKQIGRKSYFFLITSGLATGLSWLCYFGALELGKVSVISPIDKFSVVLTVILSFIILKEKPTKFTITGAILITIGTALLII